MKLNISKKIILSIIVLLLFSSVMGAYSLYSTSSAAKVSNDIAVRFIPITGYNTDITRSLLTLIRDVQIFLLQNNEIDYNEAREMIKNLNKNMEEVRKHLSDPTVRKVMPQTIIKFDELLPALEEYIQIAQLSINTAMDSLPREKQLKENIAALTKVLNDFRLNMEEAVVNEIKDVNTNVAVRASGHLNLVNTMSRLCMSATDSFTTGLSNNNVKLLQEAFKIFSEIQKHIQFFYDTAKKPSTLEYVKASEQALKSILDDLTKTIATYTEIGKQLEQQTAYGKTVRTLSAEIAQIVQTGIDTQSLKAADDLNRLKGVIGFLLFLVFAVGIGSIIVLKLSVTNKINNFIGIVKNLTSGDGDLTKRIPSEGGDELAELAGYFNKFIINVQDIVTEVKQSADDVASGNNQLASTMEELSTTFSSQTEQIAAIVTDMSNMQEVSRESADDLKKCLDIMNETSGETDNGSKKLNDVRASITSIHNKAESLSAAIMRLSESSSQIGDILTVINDIADQTNLLALNAAIEAARAGDAGRGFAVVADEVRKLAERTQKATSEIEGIIITLQKESELASAEMKEAGEAVNEGVEVIDETAKSFETVVNGVYKVKDDTNSVMKSVSGQNEVIQAVGDKTQVIASGIEESNSAINEITSTVSHLQERAEKMKHLVGQFKS